MNIISSKVSLWPCLLWLVEGKDDLNARFNLTVDLVGSNHVFFSKIINADPVLAYF